jgi:hypothetical protein
MRPLLFIYSLFFFNISLSQEDAERFVLLNKDSNSFYAFTKTGVYTSSIDSIGNTSSVYLAYADKIPSSLKGIGFETLTPIRHQNSIYFLFPGGGVLYQYKNNRIIRVDESFPHRNQFSGFFFSFNDGLYLLGGYGYWEAKNHLTKFNFKSGSWDIVKVEGTAPKGGINQGSFVLEDDKVFVYDFYFKKNNSDSDEYNPNLFELNLSTLKWMNKGRVQNPPSISFENKIQKTKISFGNSLFEKSQKNNFYSLTSPSKNSVVTYSTDNKLSLLTNNAIKVGDYIVYYSLTADRLKNFISIININSFKKINESNLIGDNENLLIKYFMFSGIFIIMLMFFLFVYFNIQNKVFHLSKVSLFNKTSSIALTNDEVIILKSFKENRLENSSLLSLFSDELKSSDATVKKKNKIIFDLNQKFEATFKFQLLIKKSDKTDSRQIVYLIHKRIKLVIED